MELPDIPGTSLEVSRVALGTWAIGGWMWGGTDEAESIATIRAALDHGINVIDTAPAYGFGRSEEIVGKAIAEAVCALACSSPPRPASTGSDGKVFRNASRARIMREIDDSLRRLRTDYIDVYQVHWPDPLVPIEETAEAMLTLFRQGKIRAIGVSNFSVEQMEQFRRVAPLHVLQPPYNLFERGIEADAPALLPQERDRDVRLWRAVPGPALRANAGGHHIRRRRSAPHRSEVSSPGSRNILPPCNGSIGSPRRRFGKRVIHLAVRWMLDQGITTALWGARHPGQLQPVDEVAGWQLDAAAQGRDRPHPAAKRSPIRSARNSWRRRRAASRHSGEADVQDRHTPRHSCRGDNAYVHQPGARSSID